MQIKEQKSFSVDLLELESLTIFISLNAKKIGLSSTKIKHLELVAEEYLVNLTEHGYADHQKDKEKIEVICEGVLNEKIEITFLDQGKEFIPPNSCNLIRKDSNIQERKPGGFGIFLMHSLMDKVEFKRQNGTNQLKIIKCL